MREVILAIIVGGVLSITSVSSGGEVGKPGTPKYDGPYTYKGLTGACNPCAKEIIRYNPYKKASEAWSYEDPKATVQYDPFNDTWEYRR
jgi:hypothetical protein